MLLPECLDDWIDEKNSVQATGAFVDTLDLAEFGFEGVDPGRPGGLPTTPRLS